MQPRFRVVSKGWMKASHRELNKQLSTEYAPWYAHTQVEPLVPGQAYTFEVPIMPTANLFKKGSRIRLELANGDFSHHGLCVRTCLPPEQDRQGHDLSLGGAALPYPAASDHQCARAR